MKKYRHRDTEKVGSGALEARCVYYLHLNGGAGSLHTAGKGGEAVNIQIHKGPWLYTAEHGGGFS